MKIRSHVISSGIISYILFLTTNSLSSAIASFLAGVFIDLDHFLDYYLNCGFSCNLKEIYGVLAKHKIAKIYVLLHSYELLSLFWVCIFLIPLSGIYMAMAIGFTQHIFFDQIFNPITSKGYFLSYRIINKFSKESIINRERLPHEKSGESND